VTQWTLEYIDALPFPDVIDLFTYWLDCPPTHLLLRGFVGYNPPSTEPTELERRFLPTGPGTPLKTLPASVQDFVLKAMMHKANANA
jgi:hypothetical protein